MTYIEAVTIGEAHNLIMGHFLRRWKVEGDYEITTEDNERTIEIPGMKVRVRFPWSEPKVSKALDFGQKALGVPGLLILSITQRLRR